jgi:serine O-acetyltransferase
MGMEATEKSRKDQCIIEIGIERDFRREIPAIVERIVSAYNKEGRFGHISSDPIPSRESVVDIVRRAMRVIYPGYFSRLRIDETNVPYYLGQEVVELYHILSDQISFAIRHDCRRFDMPCTRCEERGQAAALDFLQQIPELQILLSKDIVAAYEGDPAARYHDEIIFSYPGLFAITVHRIAHSLLEHGVPLIPRIMSEHAHSITGIDIHPGVHIGESFFIDHGTGVTIGETSEIGNRVRIYQGVTLGALSLSKEECERLRDRKRHPTIEDDVIIYANATILGGDTVIGARSVIGGNVWLTDSVPPDTTVFLKRPELVFKENKQRTAAGE